MYQPSEEMQSVAAYCQAAHNRGFANDAKEPGSRAWHVAKAYEIHQFRPDKSSEEVSIRAFEYYRSSSSSPKWEQGVQEWISSEINSYLDRDTFPSNMSARPWSTTQDHVYANAKAGNDTTALPFVAACPQHPSGIEINLKPFLSLKIGKPRPLISESNAKLIAGAPELIATLDRTQDKILMQMSQIVTNQPPLTLPSEKRAIDELLLKLTPEVQHATPGPWHYDHSTSDFMIFALDSKERVDPVAFISDPNVPLSTPTLNTIRANADVIVTAPSAFKQLTRTSKALAEADALIQAGNTSAAFDKLHTVALANDPILRQARADKENPLSLDPKPGTPHFATWIESNLKIVHALKTTPELASGRHTYAAAEQQSGIYSGPIRAQTDECYLQLTGDRRLVAHWKGSFAEPLEIGMGYNISYNQGKATSKTSQVKVLATTNRER